MNKYTKVELLLKHPLGHIPTSTSVSEKIREEKLPRLPTPRRIMLVNSKKKSGYPSDVPTSAKNTCMMHGPGHTPEECKVLKVYSDKYAT